MGGDALSRTWEIYRRRPRSRSNQPSAALRRSGTIGLNRAAYDLLSTPAAVELLYDPAARVIGLRSAEADRPNAYTVQRNGTSSFVVTSASLCKHYGIDLGSARRFTPRLEGDVLVIELDRPVGDSTRPGRRARPACDNTSYQK